jgi:hypothetical protein
MIERSHGQPSSPTVPSDPGNLQDLQPPSSMRALTNSPNTQQLRGGSLLLLVMCPPPTTRISAVSPDSSRPVNGSPYGIIVVGSVGPMAIYYREGGPRLR